MNKLAIEAFIERLEIEAQAVETLRVEGRDREADRAEFRLELAVFMAGVVKP